MKNLWYYLLVLLFVLLAGFANLQAQEVIKVESFDAISAIGSVDVRIEAAEEEKVEAYIEGIPDDKVKIQVKGGELRIKVLEGFMYQGEIVKVYVKYKKLRSVRAHAGATLEGQNTLEVDFLEAKSSSGARLELDIICDGIDVSATEGGLLELDGRVEHQTVSVATGGQYDGLQLDCARTFAKANTGGEAEVVAREKLEASANTGGKVYYTGSPEDKVVKTILAGEVSKI